MSSLLEYAAYIVRNLNLGPGQQAEIVSPLECSELVETLRDTLLRSYVNVIITYTNECNDYYKNRTEDFYKELIAGQFVRITIVSSFTAPKSQAYVLSQPNVLKSYFHSNQSQRVMAAYPNEMWAKRLGITYMELKTRIIDMSLRNNSLTAFIDDLYDLDIQYAVIKSDIGTDLKMEFTRNFIFNDGFLKTEEGIPFKANIPSIEIFTSPLKYGLNGHVKGSKPVYVNGRIITSFSLDFKDGRVVDSTGLDFVLNADESLSYCGELGLAYYSDFLFYNTLLDENLSTHIALGNAYTMGIRKSEREKLNYSPFHVDLPIGDKSLTVTFYNEKNEKVAVFKDSGMEILK